MPAWSPETKISSTNLKKHSLRTASEDTRKVILASEAATSATDIKNIEIDYKNKKIPAKEISFQPFTKTELKNRVSRYKTKKFVIVMSHEIPGFIYKIETFIKDLEDPDDMVKETLQFQGIRTNKELREEYKNRKENNKS